MDFPIKNKGGGKKDGQGQRRTKNTKKKEKQERQLGSSKGTRQKVQNIERSQMKKTESPKSKKKTPKSKKGKKRGQYVYFPDKNVIQFLPKQQGGKITDSSCSNFKPTMLNREFNCKQPFWKPDCL